jgi:hypothetical protein
MSYPLSDVVMNAHVRFGERLGGVGVTRTRFAIFLYFSPRRHAPLYFITVNTSAPCNADLVLFNTDELQYGLHRHYDHRH